MDIVGSEIGQKMRSAIKAKLTELGCYVDDELPDYVMVMVANKRTRSQMEEDLQLFLGTNTELFVGWLHKVLKKLQEVTVSNTMKQPETETEKIESTTSKVKTSSKDHKAKDKKDKKAAKERHKKGDGSVKKSKKRESKKKDKELRKKAPKKSKKKSKNDEPIRLNVPPLLMNLEKDSEPSITDVFAGQILKNHGITLEKSITQDTKALEEMKPLRKALKRNRFPIIDPATVSNVTDPPPAVEDSVPEIISEPPDPPVVTEVQPIAKATDEEDKPVAKVALNLETLPREEQIREMNEIEAKIQGLKKKLTDQMDSLSEDEDFLNIRTEAEELMNDFAEDVLQEISAAQNTTASSTPPLAPHRHAVETRAPSPPPPPPPSAPESLPHIELQLPKRPMRERLGARPEQKQDKRRSSDERVTPEKSSVAEERGAARGSRRASEAEERESRKRHVDLPVRRDDHSSKRLLSRVTTGGSEERTRAGPASVVRVRPRPRAAPGAPAPALLMRAVADAHRSLLNVAPKVDTEPQVKRAMVLPMRRNVESQNIVIQVQTDRVSSLTTVSRETSDCEIDLDTESLADLVDPPHNYNSGQEYIPERINRSVNNTRAQYVPSHNSDSSALEDDVIRIHNPTVGKECGPQFVVTLDGLDPNMFLAKKLKTEGLTDEITLRPKRLSRESSKEEAPKKVEERPREETKFDEAVVEKRMLKGEVEIKKEDAPSAASKTAEESSKRKVEDSGRAEKESIKKRRRASPIVFDVHERERKEREREKEKEKEKEQEKKNETRERKESVGSDITVTTTSSSKKYDSLPSLPSEKRRQPCRAFPACRFGSACAFSHPRCKFLSACSRRDCIYSHPTAAAPLPAKTAAPVVASHVVPVGNYKTIAPAALAVCKFYPACANLACPFLHPKPCRYGRACLNRSECNFYHHDGGGKWRPPFLV